MHGGADCVFGYLFLYRELCFYLFGRIVQHGADDLLLEGGEGLGDLFVFDFVCMCMRECECLVEKQGTAVSKK